VSAAVAVCAVLLGDDERSASIGDFPRGNGAKEADAAIALLPTAGILWMAGVLDVAARLLPLSTGPLQRNGDGGILASTTETDAPCSGPVIRPL